MNGLYDKVKEKLWIEDNMYDVMRVIDPINKKIINISNDLAMVKDSKCYKLFNRGEMCKNCISLRAEVENDTFIKLEYISDGVMLIIATPINIDGEKYIVEAMKNLTAKRSKSFKDEFHNNINSIIDDINEKVIEEKQKQISPIDKKEKLSILNYRIQELRNMLNEMTISSKDEDVYKETLKISQDLDDLIVEYMKNVI